MTQEEVLLPRSNRYETCCRLCLSTGDDPTSCRLFPVSPPPHPDGGGHQPHRQHRRRTAQLIEMILECTSIQITLEEDYPAKVCEKCVETLDKFYQYRRRCLANDQILRAERIRVADLPSTGRKKNRNNNNDDDGEDDDDGAPDGDDQHRPSSGESSHHRQRSSPAVTPPVFRIKSEPLPLDRVSEEGDEEEEEVPPALPVENDTLSEGGTSSILRSILLQTRESTTSRSSPNTEPESPRQTPQPLAHPAAPSAGPSTERQHQLDDDSSEQDVKPSLLQQMLLQQQAVSPSNRSPAKPIDAIGGHEPPVHAGGSTSSSATTTFGSTSSLLKRMLLDGSGTTGSGAMTDQVPPREGTSCRRTNTTTTTKPEPPSATNSPSPPSSVPKREQVPSGETPLASQLRSILLQHRATALARAGSLPALSPEGPRTDQVTPEDEEKPEVSYVRSLFLRNDSDSESEPPPVEDQREMLLYAMFQELRARQQQQQPYSGHQPLGEFSSDSDDSDDLPQDYRLPSVRRRSTDSAESRSKRRRMEYPCLLCGRTFAGRTKLVLHMRTHALLTDGVASGATTAAATSIAVPPTNLHSALLPTMANGSSAPAASVSDVEDVTVNARMIARHHPAGGDVAGNEDEIDALERRSYACYICGADQNNLHQLKEHLLAAHQDRIRSRGRTRERQKASIACEICQRQFRSQFAYGEHMRTHTGERPFPCDQCDKRFPRRFQLLGHLYNVHKQSWVADESKAKFAKK